MSLKSERLLLRELTQADKDVIYSYRSDPKVKEFDTFGVNTISEIEQIIDNASAWDENRSLWGICIRNSSELIGEAMLAKDMRVGSAEFGVMLNRKYWGYGYATEAIGILERISIKSGLKYFIAKCHPENSAAINLVHNLGMEMQLNSPDSIQFSKKIAS